jgi:hypothetical protein
VPGWAFGFDSDGWAARVGAGRKEIGAVPGGGEGPAATLPTQGACQAQLSNVAGTSTDRLMALLRFVGTAGSGATAAVFGGPGVLVLLGVKAVPVAMLAHFIVGLMGSAICDALIGAGPWAGDQVVAALRRAARDPRVAEAARPEAGDKA